MQWKNYSLLTEFLPLPFLFLERDRREFKKTGEPQIKKVIACFVLNILR